MVSVTQAVNANPNQKQNALRSSLLDWNVILVIACSLRQRVNIHLLALWAADNTRCKSSIVLHVKHNLFASSPAKMIGYRRAYIIWQWRHSVTLGQHNDVTTSIFHHDEDEAGCLTDAERSRRQHQCAWQFCVMTDAGHTLILTRLSADVHWLDWTVVCCQCGQGLVTRTVTEAHSSGHSRHLSDSNIIVVLLNFAFIKTVRLFWLLIKHILWTYP